MEFLREALPNEISDWTTVGGDMETPYKVFKGGRLFVNVVRSNPVTDSATIDAGYLTEGGYRTFLVDMNVSDEPDYYLMENGEKIHLMRGEFGDEPDYMERRSPGIDTLQVKDSQGRPVCLVYNYRQ